MDRRADQQDAKLAALQADGAEADAANAWVYADELAQQGRRQ
jgi:hypothetical protein